MSTRRLPSTSGPRRFLIAALALGYGGFLAFVAFWPSPVDRPVASLLSAAIREMHERGVPAFIDYNFIEFTANIVLFIPVGILFGLIGRLRFLPLALVMGPLVSIGIETVQYFFLAARYATIEDVIANSIGSTIGVLSIGVLRAVVAHRDERVIARHEARRAQPESSHTATAILAVSPDAVTRAYPVSPERAVPDAEQTWADLVRQR